MLEILADSHPPAPKTPMKTSEPDASPRLDSELVRHLIEAAIRAPSGDNCQPWKFTVDNNNRLLVSIIPERAKSFFDSSHRATFLSIGAVVENLRVEAGFRALKTDIEYLPAQNPDEPAVAISLTPTEARTVTEATRQAMMDRTVNRRPFFRGRPDSATKQALVANPVPGTKTTIFTERSSIRTWSRLIYLADRIRYSHPTIHEELFGKIRLSREQIESQRTGLEYDRLGIGPGSTVILKLLKPWQRMQRLSKIGVDAALSNQSRMLAASSGAIGLVTIPDHEVESWIRSGEQVQRVWTKAQELGVSIHPMTVALYLSQRYQSEGMTNFLPQHEPWLKEISAGLAPILQDRVGAMVFRIGNAMKMSKPSVRLPIEDFLPQLPV